MEIQQLRHLIAAVQYGNLLKAAEESYITQSGLSRSIKSLEDRLGVQLLVRKPKGVEPTIFGECLIRRGKLILNEVARAVEELRAIEEARTGNVHFGITQNYASYVVPDILAELASERPDMNVEVQTGGFLELAELVKSEALDFGFGIIGPIRQNEGLIIEHLRDHRSHVVARATHPLAGKQDVTVADLAGAQWLLLNSEAVQRGFAGFFDRHGFNAPSQVIRTDSITLIRRVCQASDVLTVLPLEAVDRKMSQGILVEIDCPTPVDQARIGLIFREGGVLTPQAHLLSDRLRQAFGKSPTMKRPTRRSPTPFYE
jgi:DNA-binding transcriptional LysR family regulator